MNYRTEKICEKSWQKCKKNRRKKKQGETVSESHGASESFN